MPVILLGGSIPPPSSVAGLTDWWSADNGAYKDAGVTLAADGETVQQWNDKSGNGYNFSQGTAGSRPTYKTSIVNSLPVLRFGGGTDDDQMSTAVACSSLMAVGAKTVFCVYKHTAEATTTLWSENANILAQYAHTTGTNLSSQNNDGVVDTVSKAGLSSGTWYIGTYLHSSGTLYVGASDTRTSSMTSTASGNSSSLAGVFVIGQNAGSNFLDGDIAEIVTYNAALSGSERQIVERYLSIKYAITLPY